MNEEALKWLAGVNLGQELSTPKGTLDAAPLAREVLRLRGEVERLRLERSSLRLAGDEMCRTLTSLDEWRCAGCVDMDDDKYEHEPGCPVALWDVAGYTP